VPDVGDSEKWSFNVPGSPSWKEVFYRSPVRSIDESRSYFSSQESKKFFVQELNLRVVTIVAGEASFYDLQNWYAKETAEPRVSALKGALRRIASGIKEAFGLEVDVEKEISWKPIYQDPLGEGKRIKFFREYEEHLLEKVEKFSSLPKSLQENGDPNKYFDALNEANEIIEKSLQFSFQSSEFDVAGLEPTNSSSPKSKNGEGPFLQLVHFSDDGDETLLLKNLDGSLIAEFPMRAATASGDWPLYALRDEISSNHVHYPRISFSKEILSLRQYLITRDGKVAKEDLVGTFTPESDYVLTSDEGYITVLDRNLDVAWRDPNDYGYVYRLSAFHQGWATAETDQGLVLVSEDRQTIDGKQLGSRKFRANNSISFGYLALSLSTEDLENRYIWWPDKTTSKWPENEHGFLPGGLVATCTSAIKRSKGANRRCDSAVQVEDLKTGKLVLPPVQTNIVLGGMYGDVPLGKRYLPGVYENQHVIVLYDFAVTPDRGYSRDNEDGVLGVWNVSGEKINNVEPAELLFDWDFELFVSHSFQGVSRN